MTLVDAFLAGSTAAGHDRSRPAGLEAHLAALLAAGREAWPTVRLASDGFMRHLGARLLADVELQQTLSSLHGTDLYLACACARWPGRYARCTHPLRAVASPPYLASPKVWVGTPMALASPISTPLVGPSTFTRRPGLK